MRTLKLAEGKTRLAIARLISIRSRLLSMGSLISGSTPAVSTARADQNFLRLLILCLDSIKTLHAATSIYVMSTRPIKKETCQ